jgi:hypothetical protein
MISPPLSIASTTMFFLSRSTIVSLLFIAASAQAADPPKKEGSAGSGKGTGIYMTREELRSCLKQQGSVEARDDELAAEKNAIAAQQASIVRDGDALKARFEGLDRTNAEAVDSYNTGVQARDKQVETFKARANAFNANVEANQLARSTWAKGCANRRFFEEDETAIRKGK